MARPLKCACGKCRTCKMREYQHRYRGVFHEKKNHCVYNRTDLVLTTVEEDCKKLEEKFPWLRIHLR
jgi:hypothetical protein